MYEKKFKYHCLNNMGKFKKLIKIKTASVF